MMSNYDGRDIMTMMIIFYLCPKKVTILLKEPSNLVHKIFYSRATCNALKSLDKNDKSVFGMVLARSFDVK